MEKSKKLKSCKLISQKRRRRTRPRKWRFIMLLKKLSKRMRMTEKKDKFSLRKIRSIK